MIALLVRGMTGGDDHVVDDDRPSVGQPHLLRAVAPGDQIDRRRRVVDDMDARWGAGDKRPVEPLEVLAHQAAGKEVVGLDRLPHPVDHATVAHPAVASLDGPLVQSNSVVRLVGLGLERVQGELPAGVVEEEVVGLGYVVDAGARGSRLDHVNGDIDGRRKLLTCCGDNALKSADAPRPQSHYCNA